MNSNPLFVLMVLAQLLRALSSSTAQLPSSTVIVPSDNVTVSGLASDVQLIQQNENHDLSVINPVGLKGITVPTSSIPTPTEHLILPSGAMYSVFDATKF